MRQLIFSTGNDQKFGMGKSVCSQYDIELTQNTFDIDEVQSEDIEYVARRKAEAAFQLTKAPVIISDDSWSIFGLNGFPGTYAKSINTWLTANDLIRLTRDLGDRRASVSQSLVYQDEHIQKYFVYETVGTILTEAHGETGAPIQKVISLEPDGKTSISEKIGTDSHYSGESTLQVWHDFAQWYTKGHKA